MKAGKALEQLVAAIQEYLKYTPDTSIELNAKLVDNAGLEREIDVFVQTKVQGGNIGIAFECKDYSDKVDVKEVEAFNSKSNDIPAIHKRIIVAANGFTSGAQTKAKLYGIELYQLEKVPLNDIFIPSCDIYYNQCWAALSREYRVIVEDDNNPEIYLDNGVFSAADDSEIAMEVYLMVILQKFMPSILPTIHNYLLSRNTDTGEIPLTITPPNALYVKDIYGGKHIVKEVYVSIAVRMNSQLQDVANQSVYSGISEESQNVRITEYTPSDSLSLFLVHGKENLYSAFIKDANGCLRKTILPQQPRKDIPNKDTET